MHTVKIALSAAWRAPARAALWLAMACSLALITNYGLLSPPPVTWLELAFPRADLLLHGLAFACLAILAFALFGVKARAVMAMLAAGAVIELLQALEPPREPSFMDMMANAAGIALAAGVVLALRKALAEQRLRRAWNGYDKAPKPQGA